MPGKTNTERIDELGRLVQAILTRLDRVEADVAVILQRLDAVGQALEAVRGRLIAVESDLAEVRRSRDEWGRRVWQAGMVVAAGVVGYYLKR